MRCPSCGTENEPDSRFCGECGTRLGPTLPPTQKIPPNAPAGAPVPRNVSTPQGAQPVVPRNVSAQPLAGGPAPRLSPPLVAPPSPAPQPPPAFAQQPPRASSPYSAPVPAPMASMPPPEDPIDLQTTKKRNSKRTTGAPAQDSLPQLGSRRRLGLILFVLIVDLGLAIAGAAMLAEGLSTDDPPPRTTSDTAAPKPAAALPAAASAPAPAPAPAPAATTTPVAQPIAAPGSSSLTNAIPDLPPPPEPEKPRHSRKKKSTGKPGSGSAPVDPYEGSDQPGPPPP